jgi:cytochrome b561
MGPKAAFVKEEPVRSPTIERYSQAAIILHWLIAVLITGNVLLALSLDYIAEAGRRPYIDFHKSIGITVLGLAALRLLWRLTHRPPAMPAYAPWERRAAHVAHWTLYFLIFAMPLTGWLHDSAWKGAATHPMKLFFTIPWFRLGFIQNLDPATKEQLHSLFGTIHGDVLPYLLYAVFFAHVAGALKHQFLDGKPEFQRMWFQRRTNTQ